MKPKISIVLPVYNGEKYLAEAIKSVINQTFKNWELIIINDCSKDKSFEIIKEFGNIDSRIKVYNNEYNLKLPATLNRGFNYATGDYLTWTSDDNIYAETALEEMYNYLEINKEIALVTTNYVQIDENGNFIKKIDVLSKDIKYSSNLGACFLYRNSIRNDIGEYDVNMFLVEDYDYWIRINSKYKIGKIDQTLYFYRVHANSLSSSRYKEIRQQFYNVRYKHKEYIFENITNEMLINLFLDTYYYSYDKEKFIDFFVSKNLDKKYIDIVKRDIQIDKDKKYIIFGCGSVGQNIVPFIGLDKIECFADNNFIKVGKEINSKRIIDFDELKKIKNDYNIILAVHPMHGLSQLIDQFEENDIKNYILFDEIL